MRLIPKRRNRENRREEIMEADSPDLKTEKAQKAHAMDEDQPTNTTVKFQTSKEKRTICKLPKRGR